MNAIALSLTLVLAAQAEERVFAPAEPELIDVPALPANGATEVALDALAWASGFNGTPRLVGPDGELEVEVARSIDGPFFLQGVRPVSGFAAETRYSLLDAFTGVVLTEFTTGSDATSPPPETPNITSAEQDIFDQTRTLRYGVAAFDDQYIFVNPDSTTNVSFANSIITAGGLFELVVAREGEVTTTFVAMNVAGEFSDAVVETHEAPTGCAQASGEPLGLLGLLGLLALRRRRR